MIEVLKRRYRYDEWRGTRRLDEELFVWGFFLAGHELSGWDPERIRDLEGLGWPRSVHSVWTRPEHGHLVLDVFECGSRIAAHELLLEALAQFESPFVERSALSVGDVAFAPAGEVAIVFARANLVLVMRHAAAEPEPVSILAGELDRWLTSRPAAAERGPPEALARFAAPGEALASGRPVPLELEAPDGRESRAWLKFFAAAGEIHVDGARLLYRHLGSGAPQVTAYAIAPGRGAAVQDLDVY